MGRKIDCTSPTPTPHLAMEPNEPLSLPLLSIGIERADERLEPLSQERLLPSASASASAVSTDGLKPLRNSRQTEYTSRFRQLSTNALAIVHSGWASCARAWKHICARSWTSETCSYALSILALVGLIATLLAHQNKPLPQWPQLVTINSIISLFSLVMRACVGVILAEGKEIYYADSPANTEFSGRHQPV